MTRRKQTKSMPFGKTPSAEISRLIEAELRVCPVGEMVTYIQLAQIKGFNRHSNRSPLSTAIDRLHADGIFFINERNVGYQRLPDDKTPIINFKRKKKIGKSARRGMRDCKAMMAAMSNGMSNDTKIQISRSQAVFGMMNRLSRDDNPDYLPINEAAIKPPSLRQSAAAFYERVCGKR